MLTPVQGKEQIYHSYMNKMVLGTAGDGYTYKDLGVTSISPDYESTSKMIEFCDNFHIKYNLIDPANRGSIGLNPFIYDDANKIAITISSALKAMYVNSHPEIEDTYREEYIIQAIENLAIMLKEMYPRLNGGDLPNLDDMLKMLTNYSIVEKMCEIMCKDPELAEQYESQIRYFKRNFYANSVGRQLTEQYLYLAVSQLDNLLRLPGVKSILCNRHNNIDFDRALADGEVTLVCTRRGDLGRTSHKAFGLFFILSMQNAVLRRPGNENSRIPHFFYIDEFPDFICKDTEAIFTLYRKYKVATTITAQNLAQLEGNAPDMKYRETIISNCANKIFLGNADNEELEWWHKEMYQRRTWKWKNNMDMSKLEYDSKWSDVNYTYEDYWATNKLGTMPFKSAAIKLKGDNGAYMINEGKLDFVGAKYKEVQPIKTYNFDKFTSGLVDSDEKDKHKNKFDPKHVNFVDDRNEIDPIQTDNTDSKYLLENENATIVNLKKRNNSN